MDRFTNATFAHAVSRICLRLTATAADLAYGMWNPKFCDADAAHEAKYFFEALRAQADEWADSAAKAIEAGTAKSEALSAKHESPTLEEGDAQNRSG